MKTLKNKYQKQILGILIFLVGTLSYAQSTTPPDKLSFHSFSITPLEVFFYKNSGGLAITGELSYAISENIFTLSASFGEEFWGPEIQQFNILYGRELKLKDWLFIDFSAGAGLFRLKYSKSNEQALGIPLVTKIRFKTGEKFSIGFKLQGNINSVENIYSIGLLLQWNY
jgi:hypothetical protein